MFNSQHGFAGFATENWKYEKFIDFFKKTYLFYRKRKQIVYKNALKEIREISKTFDFPILEM